VLVSDDAWPELAGYGRGDVLIAARVEARAPLPDDERKTRRLQQGFGWLDDARREGRSIDRGRRGSYHG
jgi:hypothetical protein